MPGAAIVNGVLEAKTTSGESWNASLDALTANSAKALIRPMERMLLLYGTPNQCVTYPCDAVVRHRRARFVRSEVITWTSWPAAPSLKATSCDLVLPGIDGSLK